MDLVDLSLSTARILDRGGYFYIVHPLCDGVPRCPPELLAAWTQWASVQEPVRRADVLVAPEAMGPPLAVPVALAARKPYSILRKRSYGLPGEAIAYCETGYGKSCLHLNDIAPGDRVAVIDDVLSTGNTLDAILGTITSLGATPTGAVVFMDKGDRAQALAERHGIPILAMRRVRIERGRVKVLSLPAADDRPT